VRHQFAVGQRGGLVNAEDPVREAATQELPETIGHYAFWLVWRSGGRALQWLP
jgi:hypothetical protein